MTSLPMDDHNILYGSQVLIEHSNMFTLRVILFVDEKESVMDFEDISMDE